MNFTVPIHSAVVENNSFYNVRGFFASNFWRKGQFLQSANTTAFPPE